MAPGMYLIFLSLLLDPDTAQFFKGDTTVLNCSESPAS